MVTVQSELLTKASKLLANTHKALQKLQVIINKADEIENIQAKAEFFKDTVLPAMKELRAPVDALEVIVDKKAWPVPTYGDLLFRV